MVEGEAVEATAAGPEQIIRPVIELIVLMMLISAELEFQKMQIIEMMEPVYRHPRIIIHPHEKEIHGYVNAAVQLVADQHNRQHEIEMHRAGAVNLLNRLQEIELKDPHRHILRRLHLVLVRGQDQAAPVAPAVVHVRAVVPAAQAVPAVVHARAAVLTAAGDVN